MNPMDTALGLFGCLLGYTRICDEMQDPDLVNLITRMSEREAMPRVTDPGLTRSRSCTRCSAIFESIPAGYAPAHRDRHQPQARHPLRETLKAY